MPDKSDDSSPDGVTVYTARKALTMDPGRPIAEAVAVKDGRILSLGTLDAMAPWLERFNHVIDDTFADKVICPGFIDPHTHFGMSSSLIGMNYVGPVESPGPDGVNPGRANRGEVLEHLRYLHEHILGPGEPLLAWGFDPAAQGGQLHRDELDEISTARPIWVLAYAPHFVYVNSPMLDMLGADEDLCIHGVQRYPDGRLNGQFVEVEAIQFAMAPFRDKVMRPDNNEIALRALGETAKRAGVTATADLAFGYTDFDREWTEYQNVIGAGGFPLRMTMVAFEASLRKIHGDDVADFIAGLTERSTDMLRFRGVKFINDGSYPSMSLRLKYPGYLEGGNGLRGDVPWDELADRMQPFWERGVPIHAHANGDETIDAVLDALEELQRRRPRVDHRFTIEHYCISTTDQARRLKALGGLASVNNYLLHYRGQLHARAGFGPDRAETTARLGSLEREGVVFALHSDAALVMAPLHPLTAVWVAVNRLAADGKAVLAEGERIGLDRAMRAITIDAAYVIGLERELGSLEVGKRADFAILEDDPFNYDPLKLKDLPVWGTVLGGVKQPA